VASVVCLLLLPHGVAAALFPYATMCLKSESTAICNVFITTCRFDFWDYIGKSMEDDFAQIVGVSLEM
jgi:hypothetical protein